MESIAEDLLGLEVEQMELDVSGMLFPTERLIVVNGGEPETRRRFTIAHELGHWVCQCLEGHTAPLYCRAEDVEGRPEAKALEREANVFAAELLMPQDAVQSQAGRARYRRSLRCQRRSDGVALVQLRTRPEARRMTQLPLRHLSIRVPWHDNKWDGTVCSHAKANASCLVLTQRTLRRPDA